ncbi:MAG: phosphatidate cytidylyltransferase [Planctomycetes bacterium]|nr:phosphatidate cytidylyltransferase [Planctomycetota bacterium]
MTSKAAKIWRRTWVGFALVGVLSLCLWQAWRSETGLVVWALGALIAYGGVHEVARMRGWAPRGARLGLSVAWLAVCLPGAAYFFRLPLEGLAADGPRDVFASYVVGAVGALAVGFVLDRAQYARWTFLGAWLLAPLPALWAVWSTYGAAGLTALILLSKIGDVLGYYVGSAIGKSHPFPRISPGKTTAGCVASLVGGTLAGAGCVALGLLPAGWWQGLVAGAAVNVAAQAGDLLESKVKRAAGVKDSGTWFGPSGGVLDLVDSLLLSVPAALVVWGALWS